MCPVDLQLLNLVKSVITWTSYIFNYCVKSIDSLFEMIRITSWYPWFTLWLNQRSKTEDLFHFSSYNILIDYVLTKCIMSSNSFLYFLSVYVYNNNNVIIIYCFFHVVHYISHYKNKLTLDKLLCS